MIYRVKMDIAFKHKASIQALVDAIRPLLPDTVSINLGKDTYEPTYLQAERCYHDETPPLPCVILRHVDIPPLP